jgi:hypothetical protein
MSTQPQSPRLVPLTKIRVDPAAQVRQKALSSVVRTYALAMKEQMKEGTWRFPPIVLFDDGSAWWLGDGRQRCAAAAQAGLSEILAEMRSGSERDALLFAISSNNEHGLPRSRADKHKAVALLLADAEWRQWSDCEIARRCQVSQPFVSKLRSGASNNVMGCARKARRDDKVYDILPPTPAPAANESDSARRGSPTPTSAPAVNGTSPPPRDCLGITLPDRTIPIFAALSPFEAAQKLHEQLAGLIEQIGQMPGGEALRPHLVFRHREGKQMFHAPELEMFAKKLRSAAPYCGHCPQCRIMQTRACKLCGGRGWLTREGFDACPESLRSQLYALRDSNEHRAALSVSTGVASAS